MAAQKVSDYLLQRLRDWGVDHVFAFPGDGINGILAAWARAGDDPMFVQSRHEEMSAFEAVGYAKFTGRVGVCMATSGPGAIHLLNGLYDAKLDHVPVVAIVGDGAMQMNGMAELITIKHYWQQWSDPRLIIAVLHNNELNQVTWELRAMEGSPKFAKSQTLPDVDFAGFAARLGLQAITVTDPDDLGAAWDQALAADRPSPRRAHRPERAPHPTPCHLRTDEGRRRVDPQGRRERLGRHHGRRQDQGPGVPAPREVLRGTN